MAVDVVDGFEAVEVEEEEREQFLRATVSQHGVLEAFEQQRAIGKSCQAVANRALAKQRRGVRQIGPGLGVDEIRGGDVSQGLSGDHVVVAQCSRSGAVEVERTEPLVAMVKRKRERRAEPGLQCPRDEHLEPCFLA